MEYTNIYPAFVKWLLNKYGNDSQGLALELFQTLRFNQASDNVIWKWLELTGDREYTVQTFFKVADKLIEENK